MGRLHRAYVALGSNLGDRHANISNAVRFLEQRFNCRAQTSHIYESSAAYVTEQPPFLNAVCSIPTELSPEDLLPVLKDGERQLDRKETFRWGPRVIDMDIAFCCGEDGDLPNMPQLPEQPHSVADAASINLGHPRDQRHGLERHGSRTTAEKRGCVVKSDALCVPHARVAEREFVLRPLCDIAPSLVDPISHIRARDLLNRLPASGVSRDPMAPVLNIRGKLFRKGCRTLVMGILNATPDSFSESSANTLPGVHAEERQDVLQSAEALADRAIAMSGQGADIIDIGGQSTRPNAPEVGAQVEMDRVLPVIRLLRQRNSHIPISVDTFHASVASAAVEAGADMVNDVSAGLRDPAMFDTVARLNVPIVLMHSRGDSRTMMKMKDYPEGVVTAVSSFMRERVAMAISSGVRRWNIVLDPGVGFAKTAPQSVCLLREMRTCFCDDLAGHFVLVGPSRKGFVGDITGEKNPQRRDWGTAGACAGAIANGADIVRVHAVAEMNDAVKMCDAIVRK
eukprot:Opistho-2@64187